MELIKQLILDNKNYKARNEEKDYKMIIKYTEKDIGDIIRLETSILSKKPKVNKIYLAVYALMLIILPLVEPLQTLGLKIAGISGVVVLFLMIKDYIMSASKLKYLGRFIKFDNIDDFDIYEGKVKNIAGSYYRISLENGEVGINEKVKMNLVNSRVNKGDKVEVIKVHARYGDEITIVRRLR